MTTSRDIALLRLAAQRIAGPGFATVTEAVWWLTAAQAQDYPGAGRRSAVDAGSHDQARARDSGIAAR